MNMDDQNGSSSTQVLLRWVKQGFQPNSTNATNLRKLQPIRTELSSFQLNSSFF